LRLRPPLAVRPRKRNPHNYFNTKSRIKINVSYARWWNCIRVIAKCSEILIGKLRNSPVKFTKKWLFWIAIVYWQNFYIVKRRNYTNTIFCTLSNTDNCVLITINAVTAWVLQDLCNALSSYLPNVISWLRCGFGLRADCTYINILIPFKKLMPRNVF
jgi:hypothetical protein